MISWLFCFHCITSSVSLTGSYSEDEPKFNPYILWSQEFNLGHNDRTLSPLSLLTKPPNCISVVHLYLKEIQIVMTVRWKAKQLKNDTKNLYIYYLFILFKENLLQSLLQRPKLLKSHNPSSPCYCQSLEILGQGPPLQQRCHSQIEYVMFLVANEFMRVKLPQKKIISWYFEG